MTKKSKRAEHLPRLMRQKQRRVLTELMLGLDDLFRTTLGEFDVRYILEMRHVYQRVTANHIKGDTSTAHEIAKCSGLPRETVRRILDDLVRVRWLDHSGSHFWVSESAAKVPTIPCAKATRLVIAAAKELQSKLNAR